MREDTFNEFQWRILNTNVSAGLRLRGGFESGVGEGVPALSVRQPRSCGGRGEGGRGERKRAHGKEMSPDCLLGVSWE